MRERLSLSFAVLIDTLIGDLRTSRELYSFSSIKIPLSTFFFFPQIYKTPLDRSRSSVEEKSQPNGFFVNDRSVDRRSRPVRTAAGYL